MIFHLVGHFIPFVLFFSCCLFYHSLVEVILCGDAFIFFIHRIFSLLGWYNFSTVLQVWFCSVLYLCNWIFCSLQCLNYYMKIYYHFLLKSMKNGYVLIFFYKQTLIIILFYSYLLNVIFYNFIHLDPWIMSLKVFHKKTSIFSISFISLGQCLHLYL